MNLCILFRHFSTNIDAVDHIQARAVVPMHHDGAGVIHAPDGTKRTHRRSLRIVHLDQLHTGTGRILAADVFDHLTGKGQQWLTRKLLDAGLLKPVAAE